MNRTDSNYRGNFTLNDQYIPRRKVINYTNCLLQQKINGESFLLKKSESDDYLFLRLTNREQKKKKKSRNIILSEHKSLFHKTHKHNVIKNQSVSKSISIEHFFRPPPPDETMSERMETVTTNADLAIKTLLAKKHIDLISMIDEKDDPEQVKEDEDVDLWAQMIERAKKGKRKFHFFDEEPKVEDNKTELLKIINNIEGKQEEEAELNRANSSNSIRRKSTKYVTMKPSVSHKATSKFRR